MKYNSKGQSTIEFITTFTATVGFIFLFLRMALNYTNGYMVHHAVYLASRGYLVHDGQVGTVESEDVTAAAHANAVFKKYLPTGLIAGIPNQLHVNDPGVGSPAKKVFVGVWGEFKQFFSIGFIGGRDLVNFKSESFLGREPTRAESYTQTCEAVKSVIQGVESDCLLHVTLDDNGG
jgi:hypothetical protein